MRTVGAYEAKTNLAKLLDEVAAGRVVTITRHGREVARLVPPQGHTSPDDVIDQIRAARRGVRRGRSTVRSMIDEGRR
jgi:prevent-host-death family protein